MNYEEFHHWLDQLCLLEAISESGEAVFFDDSRLSPEILVR